jgi:hypothetical protein
LRQRNPEFTPAFPAATNPVQARADAAGRRVWIENEAAASPSTSQNAAYGLMIRLIAHAYALAASSSRRKSRGGSGYRF